jgi:hypothetical protein
MKYEPMNECHINFASSNKFACQMCFQYMIPMRDTYEVWMNYFTWSPFLSQEMLSLWWMHTIQAYEFILSHLHCALITICFQSLVELTYVSNKLQTHWIIATNLLNDSIVIDYPNLQYSSHVLDLKWTFKMFALMLILLFFDGVYWQHPHHIPKSVRYTIVQKDFSHPSLVICIFLNPPKYKIKVGSINNKPHWPIKFFLPHINGL